MRVSQKLEKKREMEIIKISLIIKVKQKIKQISIKFTFLNRLKMQQSHMFSDYMVSDSVNRSIRSVNHSPTTGVLHKQRNSYGPRLTLLSPPKEQAKQDSQLYIEKILLLSLEISRLNNLNEAMRKQSTREETSSKLINGSKEVNVLRESNQTLKIAIKTLENSLMKAEEDKSRLKVQYQSRVNELELEMNNYAWKVQQNEKQLERARKQKFEFQLQLERVSAQKTRHELTQSRLVHKQKTLEAEKNYQIQILRETISKLENQLNELSYNLTMVQEENKKMSRRQTELSMANQEYASEFNEIRKRIDYDLTTTGVNTTLQSSDLDRYQSMPIEYKTLSRTVAELEHELRGKEEQVREKQHELRGKEIELEEGNKQVRRLEGQIRRNEHEMSAKSRQICNKEGQMREKVHELSKKEQQLRQAIAQIKQKKTQLRQKTSSLVQKQASLKQKENQLLQLQTHFSQATQQLHQTKHYLQQTKLEFHQNQTMMAQLRQNIDQLKQNNIDLRHKCDKVANQAAQKQFFSRKMCLQMEEDYKIKHAQMEQEYKQKFAHTLNQIQTLKQQLQNAILQSDLLKQIIAQQRATIQLKTFQNQTNNLSLNEQLRKTQRKLKTAQRLSTTKNDTQNIYLQQPNNNLNSHNTKLYKSRSIDSTSFFSTRKAIDFSLENIVTTTTALQGSNQRSMRLITRSQQKLMQNCLTEKQKRKVFMAVNGDVQSSDMSDVERKTKYKHSRRRERKEQENMKSSIHQYYGDGNA